MCADVLAERTTGAAPRSTSRDIVIAGVAARVDEYAMANAKRRDAALRAAAKQLLTEVHSGKFAAELGRAWDKTKEPESLEAVVSKLTKSGFDGETLSWSVIGFEAQNHIRLIWHEAHKLCARVPDRTPEDLFGWGWLGLRVAMRNYDPKLGYRFATYACQRISGAMRDGIRSESPLPKRLTTFQRKLTKAEDELAAALGRPPTLLEVAAHLGERLEALEIAPRLASAASIEELTALGERTGEGMWLADACDPAEDAVASQRRDAIEQAIDDLGAEEAEAIRLLYWEGMSVPEAREVTGATARQLRARAQRGKERLAEALRDWQ